MKSSQGNVAFYPFSIEHGVRIAILIPKFKLQSILATSLRDIVRNAIISMGGERVADAEDMV
jgi:hypothetical protein